MVTGGGNINKPHTVDDYAQGGLTSNSEGNFQSELGLILQSQRCNQRIERDLDIYRSGSAPPTVEGSFNAVGSLFRNHNLSDVNSASNNVVLAEDEIRSHQSYLLYYYSHDNINPRLPPPLLSKEDWRVAQRFQSSGSSFGGIGDLRNNKVVDDSDRSSLFSMQPGLSVHKVDNDLTELRSSNRTCLTRNASAEWPDRISDSHKLQGSRLGPRRKSFADILQEGLDQSTSIPGHLPSPASHNASGDLLDATGVCDPHQAGLLYGMESLEGLHSGAATTSFTGNQSRIDTLSHSLVSAVGSSLSRSTTPEQKLGGMSAISNLRHVGGRVGPIEKKNVVGMSFQNDHSSGITELGEIANSLSGLSLLHARLTDQESHVRRQLQMDLENDPDFPFNVPSSGDQTLQQQLREKSKVVNLSFSTSYTDMPRDNGIIPNRNTSKITSNGEVSISRRNSSFNLHSKMNSSGLGCLERSHVHIQNANVPIVDFTGRVPDDYSTQKLNSVIKNHLDTGGHGIGHGFNRLGNQVGSLDPCYPQYLQRISDCATCPVATSSDPPPVRNYFGASDGDLDRIQKAYLETLLVQQKQQYELPLLTKSGGLNQGYHRNSSYGLSMPYPENSVAKSTLPSFGSGSFQSEQAAHLASMMRNSIGGSIGSWQSDIGCIAERRPSSSSLEGFKNNKTGSFELSDIAGQLGSIWKSVYSADTRNRFS
uniref:Pumilio/Puf RNA-binding domain-containing family protein n=1 Tax=Populus alba TaxID=43335 RepID=A0A4U5R259_POPAL|nr:pumilio/Puf RNA-binding domain-containing family protein [Populus alba]